MTNKIRIGRGIWSRISLSISILLLIAISACDDDVENPVNNGDTNLPPLDESTLIVPDAAKPVWLPDGEKFLYSPKEGTLEANVYIFDIATHESEALFE
ncbi:hypothetical protein K8I28_09255, partial [bacterium]|nr:hypothetical protein [bacterium]